MNRQQMTSETFELDNSIINNTFSAINIIPDQSADVYAAVLDNANWLPDDREKVMSDRVLPYKKKHHRTTRMNLSDKAKALLAKHKLTLLQEEHALWLK